MIMEGLNDSSITANMKTTPVLILCVVALINTANAIIDGELVEISDYPYAASIIADNLHICGGSIIGNQHVLTAASCVGEYNATNLTVRVGSSFYDTDGQLLAVESINLHPNYTNPETLENNIAVLILADVITLDDSARVITVDSEGIEVIGNGTIVGWGIVVKEESGWVKPYKPSEQLRMTQQPLVGDWTCQDTFVEGWYEENMFCAGLYKSDNCVGDTGNPFVYNGIQLGIVSDTLLLCGEYPTAYVNVTVYADFINQFVNV